MKRNDLYFIDLLLRIKGLSIRGGFEHVIIDFGDGRTFLGDTISECLEVIRENFSQDVVFEKIKSNPQTS